MDRPTLLDRLGRSEGYVGIAFCITGLATGLLCTRFITEASWVALVQWTWASVVGGGAVAAYRK